MARFDSALHALGYIHLATTKDPAVAAALGYVHPGSDARVTGEWGKLAGQIQSGSAYKSLSLPVVGPVQQFGNVYIQTQHDPDRPHNVFYRIAVRKSNGRWFTLRVGYTYDPYWGDERTIGYNPNPEIIGGYFLDIIPKFDSDRSFIEGVV